MGGALQFLMPMAQMGMSGMQSAMNTGLGLIPLGMSMLDRVRMNFDPVIQGINNATVGRYNLSQGSNPYGNAWDAWGGAFGQRQDGSNIGFGEAQARAMMNMMGQNPAGSAIQNYQQLAQQQRPQMMDTTAGLSGLLGRQSQFQSSQPSPAFTPGAIDMGQVSQTNFSGAPAQSDMGQFPVQQGLPGIAGGIQNFFSNLDPQAASNMGSFIGNAFFGGGGGGGQGGGLGGGVLQGLGNNPLMAMMNPFLADRLRGAKSAPMLPQGGPVASKAMGMPAMGGAENSQATMQAGGNGAPPMGSKMTAAPTLQPMSREGAGGISGGMISPWGGGQGQAPQMSTQGPMGMMGGQQGAQQGGGSFGMFGGAPVQAQLNGQQGAQASAPQNAVKSMSAGTDQFVQPQPSVPMTPQMPAPQQGGGGQTGTYSPPVQGSLLQTLFQNPMSMSQGVQDQIVNRGGEAIAANTAALQRQMREQAAATGRLGSASLAGSMRDISMDAANQGIGLRRDVGIQGAIQNRQDLQNAAQLQLGAEQTLAQQQMAQEQMRQNLWNTDFSNQGRIIDQMNNLGQQGIQNQLQFWSQLSQLGNQGIGFDQPFMQQALQQRMASISPGSVTPVPMQVPGATMPMPYPVQTGGGGYGGGGGMNTVWPAMANFAGQYVGGGGF